MCYMAHHAILCMLPLQGWRHRKQAAAAFVVKPVAVPAVSAASDQRDDTAAVTQPPAGSLHGVQWHLQQPPPQSSDAVLGREQSCKDLRWVPV